MTLPRLLAPTSASHWRSRRACGIRSCRCRVLVDRFDRVSTAVHIAQDTHSIALQSVLVGMTLSVAGMMAAAIGYLPPIAGALVQEAIDVAVVFNALRALRSRPEHFPQMRNPVFRRKCTK